jgi:hypothetical protein
MAIVWGRLARHIVLLGSGAVIALSVILGVVAIRSWFRVRPARRFDAALGVFLLGVAGILWPIVQITYVRQVLRADYRLAEFVAGLVLLMFGAVGLAAEWPRRWGAPIGRRDGMDRLRKLARALARLAGKGWRRLKAEPAMVAGVVSAAIGWAATQGFELTEAQEGIVWILVSIAFGAGVRQVVTPTSKLEDDGY